MHLRCFHFLKNVSYWCFTYLSQITDIQVMYPMLIPCLGRSVQFQFINGFSRTVIIHAAVSRTHHSTVGDWLCSVWIITFWPRQPVMVWSSWSTFHHGLTAVSDVVINVTVASIIIIIVYTHAAPPGSPVIVDKTSIMLQPIPLKRGHNWKFTASFELS